MRSSRTSARGSGCSAVPDWKIPLSDVDLGDEERAAVDRVVASGWLTLGAEVRAFEEEFAASCAVDDAVAVANGTAALHLACLALGVGPGVEVIVPSLTFVASANAIALSGGRPVFADSVSTADPSVDPADIERRITPATRGIMCVHYAGYPCRMDELLDLCERHGLFLIEDAAHAPGATWEGRALGTIGDAGCFSFFGNKNLTTGEGGMVLARDPDVLGEVRLMRSHGMTTMSWDRFKGHASAYDVVRLGFNYRPSELMAALGRPQLAKLTAHNERRNALIERYRARLDRGERTSMPFRGQTGSGHLAVIVVDRPEKRDPLREALAEAGIQTSLHYPPVHLFDHYRSAYGHAPGDLPVAEDLAQRLVTLPLYPTMGAEQVDAVCDVIDAFFEHGPNG
jgi:dTDP-4-amino-4,6-dideoxygalactose transaminase